MLELYLRVKRTKRKIQSNQSKKQSQKFTIAFLHINAYNIINKIGKDVITMRETRILEFKETITNTFLKTVSAFSNYDGGTILFGVAIFYGKTITLPHPLIVKLEVWGDYITRFSKSN